MQNVAYTTQEYQEQYKYPERAHFNHKEFDKHFIRLSDERNNKINQII